MAGQPTPMVNKALIIRLYFWGSPGLGEGVGWLAINPLVSKGPSFMKLQFVQCLLGLKLAHGRALRPWHQETKHAKKTSTKREDGVEECSGWWHQDFERCFCSRKMMCCIFLAILIHGFSHIEIHAALIYIHSIMSRDSVHGNQWPNTAPTKWAEVRNCDLSFLSGNDGKRGKQCWL